MKFTKTFFLTVLATMVSAQTPSDVFACTSLGSNCFINMDPVSAVFSCTCTENGDQSHLADFYTRNNYKGYLWKGYGTYGSCVNLPKFWDQNCDSMKSAIDPEAVCCLYTDSDCNEYGHDWLQINGDGSVADFIYPYGGTRSFRCSQWKDESSTCYDDTPNF